jgi:hypothetical protein
MSRADDTTTTDHESFHRRFEMSRTQGIATFLVTAALTTFAAAAQQPSHPAPPAQPAKPSGPTHVAAAAAGGGKLEAAQLVTAKAKVDAIDLAKREVTLKRDDGTTETVLVSEEVKNLPQLKVGDTVTLSYYESLTMSLNKTEGAAPAVSEKASEVRAEPGKLPGGVRSREITVVAKVTAIDLKENTATLTGPKGNSVILEASPEVLAKIKVGDLVNAVYTEAVAVKVERATP